MNEESVMHDDGEHDTSPAASPGAVPAPAGDIGAIARRVAATQRAAPSSGGQTDVSPAGRVDGSGERGPGLVIGLALGVAAVGIVLARTAFRRH